MPLMYDDNGAPVIKTNRRRSEPCGYRGIAQLRVGNKLYIAVGDYFAGGELQPGVVYQVTRKQQDGRVRVS